MGNKPVRSSWSAVPASKCVAGLAAQFGGDVEAVSRPGGVWWLGVPTESDQVVAVFLVPGGLKGGELQEACKAAGTKGVATALAGDSVVVKDAFRGVKAIREMHAELGRVRAQWLVEVRFVELSKTAALNLGVDWSVTGAIGAKVGASFVNPGMLMAANSNFSAGLDMAGAFEAEERSGNAKILNSARLHVVEGEAGTMQVGETVPIPQKNVSNNGSVTTKGFDKVDSGFLLSVNVSREGGGIRVHLEPEMSDITSYVDGYPVLSRRRASSSAVIKDGGVVVLGGLTSAAHHNGKKGLPGLTWLPVIGGTNEQSTEDRRLFIIARVVSVASPVSSARP